MSAPSKESLSMDNGVCHLLVVSYSIDATLELNHAVPLVVLGLQMAADEVERGVEEALLQEVERKQQQQLGAGSAAPGFPGPSSHVQNVF
jgi:hypothetical protein